MEAVLGKGASIGLNGLKALSATKSGAAFIKQIEGLASAAKQTIAETKVPVKVTAEVLADAAGGTTPIVNVEKKTIGELVQNMEARAKEVLSSGAEKVKAVNLPAWNKLTVDMEHTLSGHKASGSRLTESNKMGGNKDVFPEWMTDKQILSAIKEAYGNAKKLGTQVDLLNGEKRIELLGESNGVKIKMYVNVTTKKLETAFPQW